MINTRNLLNHTQALAIFWSSMFVFIGNSVFVLVYYDSFTVGSQIVYVTFIMEVVSMILIAIFMPLIGSGYFTKKGENLDGS